MVHDVLIPHAADAAALVACAALLPAEDLHDLRALAAELEDTWRKRQLWRTETEMRVSVLNDLKHPTRASKYWQAVREQAVFAEQLVMLAFDYRRKQEERKALEAEAAMHDAAASNAGLPAEADLHRARAAIQRIEAERATYQAEDMRLQAKDRLRELRLWSRIKAELDDGSFDITDPNTHQLESYREQFRREAELGLSSNAGPHELRNVLGKYLTVERVAGERTAPRLHGDATP